MDQTVLIIQVSVDLFPLLPKILPFGKPSNCLVPSALPTRVLHQLGEQTLLVQYCTDEDVVSLPWTLIEASGKRV
jgi:hypothetical protein